MIPVDRAVSGTGMKIGFCLYRDFQPAFREKNGNWRKNVEGKKQTNHRSVANVYFDARAVDEDEDIDENYSDYSDDSADDCTDGYSDCEFDYSASHKTERSKVEEFVKNTCEILV